MKIVGRIIFTLCILERVCSSSMDAKENSSAERHNPDVDQDAQNFISRLDPNQKSVLMEAIDKVLKDEKDANRVLPEENRKCADMDLQEKEESLVSSLQRKPISHYTHPYLEHSYMLHPLSLDHPD